MSNRDADSDIAAYMDLSRAMKEAWAAALHLTGCIGCARREIELNVAGEAWATEQWIIGQQPNHSPAIALQRRGGVSPFCRECRGRASA